MMRYMRRIQLPMLWLMLATAATAQVPFRSQDESSCRRFAQEFYDWYVPFTQKRLHMPAFNMALKWKADVFSSELLQALRTDAEAQARVKGEIVGLDFDPFVGSQDPADHYEARQPTLEGGKCTVEVWRASPTDRAAKLNRPEAVAELKEQNGQWRFVNFRYPIGGPDLLRLLANLREERRKH